MKKFHPLLLLPVVLLMYCKTSQKAVQQESPTAEISATINSYFDHINRKDIEGAMDYIYPGLFEIVPKAAMVEGFEELFNDTTLRFSFDSLIVKSISAPVRVEGQDYARVDYDGYMSMQLLGDVDSLFVNMMKMALSAQFGNENVTYLESDTAFSLHTIKSLIAIQTPENKEWKFIENNPEMKAILEQIIPAAVLVQLGL